MTDHIAPAARKHRTMGTGGSLSSSVQPETSAGGMVPPTFGFLPAQ